MQLLRLIGKSQLFVALCAFFLCAESYLIAEINPDYIVLSIVFFATLFVYNASRLSLSFVNPNAKNYWQITINGSKYHVIFCIFSFVMVFLLLTTSNIHQVYFFLFGALLSVAYLMPFSKNGKRVKGLRNHLIFKNILLSLIWALATVLFPFAGRMMLLENHEILFIFLRHFLFIYALTVVYDMRDLKYDSKAGMKTLAMKLGENGTRIYALVILFLFVMLVAFDPGFVSTKMEPVKLALYVSALISAVIVASVRKNKSNFYYLYVVDGAMIIQYGLVLLFTGLFQ